MGMIGQIQKRFFLGVDTQENVAAFTAIAAIGSAAIDVLFPAERKTAVPPAASTNGDTGGIDKHRTFTLFCIPIMFLKSALCAVRVRL